MKYRLSHGASRGVSALPMPVMPCVIRPAGVRSHTHAVTVALDIEAISEQADIEADDAPAGADRAWWAR